MRVPCFVITEVDLNQCDAGFDKPTTKLDELRKQAETIKQKKIADYPIFMDLSKGSDAMWDFFMKHPLP